jgi:acylphosphatase
VSETAARFHIAGKVQGVFFRASTREEALRLGLRGYARNLADGGVDVLAVGEQASIDALGHWLQRGPPHARVNRVERQRAEASEAGEDFETA